MAKAALVSSRSVFNKTFVLNYFFIRCDLVFLFLTETWIGAGESSAFGELCPTNCSCLSTPRSVGKGGGVAVVFKNCFKVRKLSFGSFSSLQIQCTIIKSATTPLICVLVIYFLKRIRSNFITKFVEFLSHCDHYIDCVLILGEYRCLLSGSCFGLLWSLSAYK